MEVIVQDANNIVIEVDQGRQGRGVEDVSLITVGADYYLLFTFTDGTTDQVGPIATTVTEVISAEVRNAEAVTILKGQPVYLYQAQGNLATVKLAYNTSDATSAKTLGLAAENIAPGAQGLVTCQGTLGGLNTSAYNEGDTLYLGPTAGTLTNVKPQAPNHLVYIGVVERANAGAGQIYVRVQNGYELDEIHDVRIVSPVNGNTLIYDAATDLWKNAGITAGSGISVTNGASSITVGNTGVLSFSGGTTGLTPATATTGAVTLAGTLSTANGGTGLTSFTANRVLYTSSTSAIGQSANLTFDGTNLAVGSSSAVGGGRIGAIADLTASNGLVLRDSATTYANNDNYVLLQNSATAVVGGLTHPASQSLGVWGFDDIRFLQSSLATEQMRLTSTGLGIGTSAPEQKLDVYGASGTVRSTVRSGTSFLTAFTSSTLTDGSGIFVTAGGPLAFAHANTSSGGSYTERMRLDASGNLGIGTNSPGTKLDVKQSGANWYDGIRVVRSTNDNQRLVFGNTSGASWIASVDAAGGINNDLIFGRSTNGITFAESGRFNATGNLLVGTTTNTNSSLLTVNGTISETVSSVQYLVASQFDVGTAPNKIPLNQYLGNLAYQNASAIAGQAGFSAGTAALPSIASATDLTTGRWFPAAGVMAWSTAGAERMRLDASGNLGLGTTPSAWAGGFSAMQYTGGAVWSGGGYQGLNQNAFYNGSNWIYRTTAVATNYEQNAGAHRWYTAPSGTAGNAISFTQALTLDANRNLALNTTSVGTSAIGVLSIGSGTEPSTGPADTVQFYSVDRSAGNTIPAIYCEGSGVTNAGITNVTVTNKIAIKINGTVYYLLATTNAT